MFKTLIIFGGGFLVALIFSYLRKLQKKHERIINWKIENDKNLYNEGAAKYIRLALLDDDKANTETEIITSFRPRGKV